MAKREIEMLLLSDSTKAIPTPHQRIRLTPTHSRLVRLLFATPHPHPYPPPTHLPNTILLAYTLSFASSLPQPSRHHTQPHEHLQTYQRDVCLCFPTHGLHIWGTEKIGKGFRVSQNDAPPNPPCGCTKGEILRCQNLLAQVIN